MVARGGEASMVQKRAERIGISETKLLLLGVFSLALSPPSIFLIPPTLFTGYHVSCANQYFISVASEQ